MRTTILIFFVALLINDLIAQTEINNLPGDTTLPSSKGELMKLASLEKGSYEYSIEDFIQYPTQYSFQFSPNGLYLSYKERDEKGKIHVYIKNTLTDEVTCVIEQGKDLISEYGWANNERLYYLKDNGGDEIYHLFAVDIDGKNQVELTPFNNVETVIINRLKGQKDYMIIKMNKDNHQIYEPYNINIKTGKLDKLFEISDPSNQIHSYNFNKNGVLKGYTQLQNGTDYVYFYCSDKNTLFKEVVKRPSKDKFKIIDFDYSTENPNDAFVISNIESNTDEIISYDFEKKQVLKKNIFK